MEQCFSVCVWFGLISTEKPNKKWMWVFFLCFSHLHLVNENRDLNGHFLVILNHQVVGERGAVDPVHHQHIHMLHPEQGLGQILHPGRPTTQGPAGVTVEQIRGGKGQVGTCSWSKNVFSCEAYFYVNAQEEAAHIQMWRLGPGNASMDIVWCFPLDLPSASDRKCMCARLIHLI